MLFPFPAVGCSAKVVPASAAYESDPSYRKSAATDVPLVVRRLAQDLPGLNAAFNNAYGSKLYRTSNPEMVILYAPYMRCIVLDEIT
jgi:hypothetical protein